MEDEKNGGKQFTTLTESDRKPNQHNWELPTALSTVMLLPVQTRGNVT